jgi:hypothetical protein
MLADERANELLHHETILLTEDMQMPECFTVWNRRASQVLDGLAPQNAFVHGGLGSGPAHGLR